VRGAVPVLAWAALLTVLAGALWAWTSDPLPPGLITAAAAATWGLGLFFLARRARPRRAVPELSMASVLVAVGIALLVVGAILGPWLDLIGAGALVLGAGGVGRELLAQRRQS